MSKGKKRSSSSAHGAPQKKSQPKAQKKSAGERNQGAPPKRQVQGFVPKTKPKAKAKAKASDQTSSSPPAKLFFLIGIGIVGGLLVLNLINKIPDPGTEIVNSVPENVKRKALSGAQIRGLAPFIESVWKGEVKDAPLGAIPAALKNGEALVFVQARGDGLKIGRPIWRQGSSAQAALTQALQDARSRLDAKDFDRADTLEMVFAHSFLTIDPKGDRGKISNVRRGLRGLEFIYEKKSLRVSPTEMLATNRDFKKVIERFEIDSGVGKGATATGRVRTRIFEADQMLVMLHKKPLAVEPMVRGNQVVPISDVTQPNTQTLADALSGFLFANLQENGRQVYKWWPSRGDEATSNNMIRQWMATVAMGRVARKNDDDPGNDNADQLAKVAKNIDYNLAQFYHEEPAKNGGEPVGLIEHRGKVKLGAIALTALAIAEHPSRLRWSRQEKAIQRTMDELWEEGGYMRSFYKPKGYRDFHNFYPGEALLYWSTLLEKDGLDTSTDGKTKLLDRFLASVWYFKDWHLANRNPAFIPWHTQAYYKLWKLTGDEKVRDWTLEMNDWLILIQEWNERPRFPDTNGRFYPGSNVYGPPHSSSTGVYLEGLIFAWKMAKESNQPVRQEKYRQSIMRGLRSCMQLAFIDEIDMFYVNKRDRVHGGVRETVYDNEVRVDNVQHNLMGQLNILRFMAPEDFRP